MKNFSKKIKIGLVAIFCALVAFVALSKSGILFSKADNDVIMVSTTKKSFDPNRYMASVVQVTNPVITTTEEVTTTTVKTQTTTTTTVKTTTLPASTWTGPVLSKSAGVVYGPSGKETYYNLNMDGIVRAMRSMGFSEADYPYWVRSDGVKMLGSYVMVAAAYSVHPKGSLVESSLGMAIVCDTGGFANNNPNQLDIAVTW